MAGGFDNSYGTGYGIIGSVECQLFKDGPVIVRHLVTWLVVLCIRYFVIELSC
jgi:hypothetical protein